MAKMTDGRHIAAVRATSTNVNAGLSGATIVPRDISARYTTGTSRMGGARMIATLPPATPSAAARGVDPCQERVEGERDTRGGYDEGRVHGQRKREIG